MAWEAETQRDPEDPDAGDDGFDLMPRAADLARSTTYDHRG